MTGVRMREVTKYYPATEVLANDHVSFDADFGEIHALVGQNGAGKSTLMKILAGELVPDIGEVHIEGYRLDLRSPRVAAEAGIGMVHQHLRLVPELTVAENVFLGREPRRGLFVDRAAASRRVRETAERFGIGTGLEPDRDVAGLEIAERQAVEILRLLTQGLRVLILDEPTSALTEQQKEDLFATLRTLADEGRLVVLVSHKVEEVLSIADRVTVMRAGSEVATRSTAECDRVELTHLMVGHDVSAPERRTRCGGGKVLLRLRHGSLHAVSPSSSGIRDVSLDVRTSEILGVTGITGSGLRDLEDALSGRRPLDAGEISIEGVLLTAGSSRDYRRSSLAYVPSDRSGRGSSLESSVLSNLMVEWRDAFSPFGLFRPQRTRSRARRLLQSFDIDTGLRTAMKTLSGGNRQRLILARELETGKPLALFAEPTWGIDVEATAFVHQKILALRDQGRAVVLISSDLDEVLALADRILVLRGGEVAADLTNAGGLTKRELGRAMLGLRQEVA